MTRHRPITEAELEEWHILSDDPECASDPLLGRASAEIRRLRKALRDIARAEQLGTEAMLIVQMKRWAREALDAGGPPE